MAPAAACEVDGCSYKAQTPTKSINPENIDVMTGELTDLIKDANTHLVTEHKLSIIDILFAGIHTFSVLNQAIRNSEKIEMVGVPKLMNRVAIHFVTPDTGFENAKVVGKK